MSSSSLYTYSPLSGHQIRVLTLFPGPFGDAIRVRLDFLDLSAHLLDSGSQGSEPPSARHDSSHPFPLSTNDTQQYEALSYAWGDKTKPQRVQFLDGSYLPVTQSLHLALKYLRFTDRSRRLWADAVCIDQTDLSERADQVGIMATIFRSADRVLIWLGEAQPGDALAFAMLYAADICSDAQLESEDLEYDYHKELEAKLEAEPRCPCCGIASSTSAPDPVDGSYLAAAYRAVIKIHTRAWFYRTWVYQKAACAEAITVHCGTHYCDWRVLEDFSNPEFNNTNPSDLEKLYICRTSASQGFDPTTLLRLLIILLETQCEEPQDVVFAIRSIAGLEIFPSLALSYTTAPAEVYRCLVMESLLFNDTGWNESERTTQFWNRDCVPGLPLPHISLFLALPQTTQRADNEYEFEGLPSWVPAFNRLSSKSFAKYYEYGWHLRSQYLTLHSCPDWTDSTKAPKPGKLQIEADCRLPKVLRILGCLLGEVTEVLERSESPLAYQVDEGDLITPDHATLDVFRQWIIRCKQFAVQYHDFSLRNFKELMYCATLENGFNTHIYDILMQDKPLVIEGKGLQWILREFTEDPSDDEHKKMRYYDRFRNLAIITDITQRIWIGWVPERARRGDALCAFVGCPRPFVLRKLDNDNFMLIGDAWIYGLSEEILASKLESERRWFNLE